MDGRRGPGSPEALAPWPGAEGHTVCVFSWTLGLTHPGHSSLVPMEPSTTSFLAEQEVGGEMTEGLRLGREAGEQRTRDGGSRGKEAREAKHGRGACLGLEV